MEFRYFVGRYFGLGENVRQWGCFFAPGFQVDEDAPWRGNSIVEGSRVAVELNRKEREAKT